MVSEIPLCAACEGTGEVRIEVEPGVFDWDVCDICDGDGYVYG